VSGHMSRPFPGAPHDEAADEAAEGEEQHGRTAQVRQLRPANRRTTGRERHEEKITVYVSSDELFALERARLVLRAEHGIAVDRGRLVREAVAEMLIDLDSQGDDSVVVTRLRPS
jgi:hypothetical protein